MNKKHITLLLYVFSFLAVAIPVVLQYQKTVFSSSNVSATLFPYLGLIMISLLWLHSLMGVWEEWLREYIAFDWFVAQSAMVILFCLILHPLLLLIAFSFNLDEIYAYYGKPLIIIGILSWILLISYDITKPFKKYHFISKYWNNILFISNLGFLLSFFHALKATGVSSTVPLKYLLIFYGLTGAMGIIYTYIILPFKNK